jgi:hypothetical protein
MVSSGEWKRLDSRREWAEVDEALVESNLFPDPMAHDGTLLVVDEYFLRHTAEVFEGADKAFVNMLSVIPFRIPECLLRGHFIPTF